MNNNMREAIHQTLYIFLKQEYTISKEQLLDLTGIEYYKNFCKYFKDRIKKREAWFSSNFININNVKKSYFYHKINGIALIKEQIELQPRHIGLNNIINANIQDQELLIFVKTLLVCSLFNNHFLSLDQDQNKAWTDSIFNEFGYDKEQLVNSYNEIRESPFMYAMREQYFYNGLTYAKIMEQMFSLEHKAIDGWDKFCHFFAHIMKFIYYTLGAEPYQSTKDLKEAHNTKITTENNIDIKALESWTEFSKRYETNVKKALGHQP